MSEITLNLKEGFPYTPLQILWITQLKSYPERQTNGELGRGTPEKYKACCLGEGLLCIARIEGTELPFRKTAGTSQLIMNNNEDSFCFAFPSVSQAYKLGLYSTNGKIRHIPEKHWASNHSTLSDANDDGITWTQIAELMEQYPEVVFNNLETK